MLSLIAPTLGVVVSLVIAYFMCRQQGIRPIVRDVFILVVFVPVLVNIAHILRILYTSELMRLALYALWNLATSLGAILVCYFILLLTRYPRVNRHREFIRDMRNTPYLPFVVYTGVFLLDIAAILYAVFFLSGPLVSRIANTALQTIEFIAFLAYLSLPTYLVGAYVRVHRPSPTSVRHMYLLLSGFIGIGTTTYLFSSYLLSRGLERYSIEAVIDIALLGVIIYALHRSGFLHEFVLPVTEEVAGAAPRHKLPPGTAYLVEEAKSGHAFTLFADHVKHGVPGLLVTRTFPGQVRQRYGLLKTRMLWLTDVSAGPGAAEPVIQASLEDLSIAVNDFLRNAPDSIVVLDGIEYVITKQGFTRTIQFLSRMRDIASQTRTRLLVPVNPDAFEEKELALLERELDVYGNPP